jgi:hypothetical protein
MFNEIPNLPPYLIYVYPDGWGNIKWGEPPEKLGDDRIFLRSYKTNDKNITMYVYKKQNELKKLGDFKIDEVLYTFANLKLDRAVIVFEKDMPFEKIKKFLVDRYSKPSTEDNSNAGWAGWYDLSTNTWILLTKEEGQNLKILLVSATLPSLIELTE